LERKTTTFLLYTSQVARGVVVVVWEARGRGGGQELLGDKFSSIEQGSSESRSLLTQRPRMRDESMTTEEVVVQEEEERRKGRRGGEEERDQG